MFHRVAGIETEYGCLVREEGGDAWPVRVKDHLFRKMKAGAIDLHYRDYEEPPGNGGFLLNGGRLYVDMGHLEYATPECAGLGDLVAADLAGDRLVQRAVRELKAQEKVAFIKNNIDHQTGATFGCHENYLLSRHVPMTPEALGVLLSFLATRQIFTGAGRVGQTNPLSFDLETAARAGVDFQLSQRADHIVNDVYQWVQFNRAIINARDEPLADHRRYRRLHLLVGDSNMSPFATALKIGTTALILTLLEEGAPLPADVVLEDAVVAMRAISHAGNGHGVVTLEGGKRTRDALDLQFAFLAAARDHLAGRDEEGDWVLKSWQFTLEALEGKPELLLGGVDWVSKRWLLEMFRESERLEWNDPWLQSLDIEYHNIDPERGLFFSLTPAKWIGEWNARMSLQALEEAPPADTRAAGRAFAVRHFIKHPKLSYVVNWDSITAEDQPPLALPDPFDPAVEKVEAALRAWGV